MPGGAGESGGWGWGIPKNTTPEEQAAKTPAKRRIIQPKIMPMKPASFSGERMPGAVAAVRLVGAVGATTSEGRS